MKGRRKSEIAEAVANEIIKAIPVSKYLEQGVKGVLIETIADILAAHYEPAPEPPARDTMHSEDEVGCFHYFVDHRVCKYCGERAAPSVSEEQPAYTRQDMELDVITHAPHRATIALIPCPMSNQKCWHIEIDGVRPDGELGMCGTKAEAKAKMESLRGENNGGL